MKAAVKRCACSRCSTGLSAPVQLIPKPAIGPIVTESPEHELKSADERRASIACIVGCFGLAVVCLIVVVVAAIPLITSGTRDADKAEGEVLLATARDMFRTGYAKNHDLEDGRSEVAENVKNGVLVGKWYRVDVSVGFLPDGRVRITALPTQHDARTGTITFEPESGISEFEWH